MKTAIELITEVIESVHVLPQPEGLEMAAIGILSQNPGEFPADWDDDSAVRICNQPPKERMILAAAYLAVAIDQLQAK